MRALLPFLVVCLTSPVFATPDTRTVGATYWVGQRHFQYVGKDASKRSLWLYPHLDGVSEILTDKGDAWYGPLGSAYDPRAGTFTTRFGAVELLDQLLAKRTTRAERRVVARVLALFVRLHPTDEGPYYLKAGRKALKKHLTEEGSAWVTEAKQTHDRLISRLAKPGTRVLPEPAELRTSDDHYRSLVGDGYLDIAVVGGNSEDKEKDVYYSRPMADELLGSLRKQGFKGRWSSNTTVVGKTIRLFGQSIRVRLRLTSAGHKGGPERRSVANFVEGLAGADVVVYYGHSNKGSGYYLSESRSKFSRFKGADLGTESTKLYRLGKKPHQIVVLNSCISYERYCLPIRKLLAVDTDLTAPAFAGTNQRSPTVDFSPRCAKLIELLTQRAGPSKLSKAINAIRPNPKSADMLFRGVLQVRDSFVVPKGVTVSGLKEAGPKGGFVVTGIGSDGQVYASTGVFPQDRPGEIVQVVSRGKAVFGVSRDGRLLEASGETIGAPVEIAAPSDPARRIVFAVSAKLKRKRGLYLLNAQGALGRLAKAGDRVITIKHDPPPAGVRFVAIGNTADGRFVALDAAGKGYESSSRRWVPLAEAVALVATPSLLGGAEVRLVR